MFNNDLAKLNFTKSNTLPNSASLFESTYCMTDEQLHESKCKAKSSKKKLKESDDMVDDDAVLLDEALDELLDIVEGRLVLSEATGDIKRLGAKYAHAEKRFDDKADKIIGDIRNKIKTDDEEQIVRGALPKASKIIKGAIAGVGTVGAVALGLNPAIAAIGLIGSFAVRKKIKLAHKQMILAELKQELNMVQEKLKDAESEGDKKSKYELMRIKYQLEKNIQRIQYNLKGTAIPDKGSDN